MNLIAEPIISFFFGADFYKSSEILEIYAIVLIVSFFQSINNKILVLHNLQHMIFKRAILALVANAILNFLLIPIYGIKGAAFSTVLSEVVVLLSYSLNHKTRFIFVYQIRAMCFVDLFNAKAMKSIR
jgi:O-antigen/teichoic acid export membrane protein